MDPGGFKYRVKLQSKVVTRDSVGGEQITWLDELTTWASAAPLSGSELIAAQQMHAETTMRFSARYRRDVVDGWRVGWRLIWEGRRYDILNVSDVGGEHWQMDIDCSTGVRDG